MINIFHKIKIWFLQCSNAVCPICGVDWIKPPIDFMKYRTIYRETVICKNNHHLLHKRLFKDPYFDDVIVEQDLKKEKD